MDKVSQFFVRLGSIYEIIITSKYKGVLLSAVVVISLIILRRILTKLMESYLRRRAFKEENAAQFMMTWKYIWTAIISIFGIIALSGS
ncbi:hypothetical protein GF312_10330, partial [Candidatus Poribacteria bacterium]|nr:hypothetical protein [Candidatus Poribacteria bacterium]